RNRGNVNAEQNRFFITASVNVTRLNAVAESLQLMDAVTPGNLFAAVLFVMIVAVTTKEIPC
ncbi:hypothetical protein, partial [Staphylococcus aureus]|uniref:hypothetical protein n=1 Tax=Staphylococcus aureus TaxID=1280 RepID=UPI001C108634